MKDLADELERLAVEAAARDIWVFFKSFGRAGEGAGETQRWFDNNKSLGGPKWLIGRLSALRGEQDKGERFTADERRWLTTAADLLANNPDKPGPSPYHDHQVMARKLRDMAFPPPKGTEWWVDVDDSGDGIIKFKDGRGRLRWWPVSCQKAAAYRLGSIEYFRGLLSAIASGTTHD